jgi:hypothetical protein
MTQARVFVFIVTFAILATSAAAQQSPQTTLRDSSGRTVGTATTDSQGTVTFRDSGGRTTGTATFSNQGNAGNTTTFRDAGGRTTGTTTAPFGARR